MPIDLKKEQIISVLKKFVSNYYDCKTIMDENSLIIAFTNRQSFRISIKEL